MFQEEGIRNIAKAVRDAGGRALLVGGFVRDKLRGEKSKDADIEVYGLEPAALREVLARLVLRTGGSVNCVGESFKVYKVDWEQDNTRVEFDVSIPRRDKKVGEGHKGFEVEGDPFSSFEDAARRRDFTINAIMEDPLTGQIIDPFGGRQDLKDGIIRVVDPQHFIEDSLRVLRAVQFASRFNFKIEPESKELMRNIDLLDLPKERVWGEFEKIFLKSLRPSVGFKVALEIGVFDQLFPSLDLLLKGSQALEFLEAMDRAQVALVAAHPDMEDAKKITVLLSVMSAWLPRIIIPVDLMLDVFGVYSINGYNVREKVIAISQELFMPPVSLQSDGDLRRLSMRVPVNLLAIVFEALNRGDVYKFNNRMRKLGVFDAPPDPILRGRHLILSNVDVKPGPAMGEVLQRVFEEQLDGNITDLSAAIRRADEIVAEMKG